MTLTFKTKQKLKDLAINVAIFLGGVVAGWTGGGTFVMLFKSILAYIFPRPIRACSGGWVGIIIGVFVFLFGLMRAKTKGRTLALVCCGFGVGIGMISGYLILLMKVMPSC